ncbi:hypothetical protein NHE_0028 [Neorickettsia helminthoeca str. Oregon]|uniref:Uncharacterized protein n=1 Tax=Neorickettsia helminthoeca str. Oregon TaxID=1286528 RepID=X5H2X9_9RICK|nr:hypothetical protein [Neorickettsia helminthoeca]AHX11003.1 hypothetical protein NHE_0028 [Neorickettsia helminthoeca str. Oregon]
MQGKDGKISRALKRKLEGSGIIGQLAEGITTRSATLEKHKEIFFSEVALHNPDLAEFCRRHATFLGLQDLGKISEEAVRTQAQSFLEGYEAASAMKDEVKELQAKMLKASEHLGKANPKAKKMLVEDLKAIGHSGTVAAKLMSGLESVTGIDMSKGFSGLMKGLASKIGPKGGDSDPTKTKSDMECLLAIKGAKSVSMPLTLVKGIMVAVAAPQGIPLAGAGLTMFPIVMMVWPALAIWDLCNLPQNIMGSPFASGNLNILVRECEAGFCGGPKIAENLQDLGPSGKKQRSL